MVGRDRLSLIQALSAPVRQELRQRLAEGELVQWIGKPAVRHSWAEGEISQAKGRFWRVGTIALKAVVGGIPAVFLTLGVFGVIEEMFRTGWPGVGQLIMVAIMLSIAGWLGFGYWILVLLPLFMMWQAARTDYVLTDQRAFVLRDFKGGVFVREWRLNGLKPEVLRETKSGVGDVILGTRGVTVHSVDMGTGEARLDMGFHAVRNPQRVADRICALRDASLETS